MNGFIATALSGLVGVSVVLSAGSALAYYEDAWAFVCDWECGEADFEPEYGGYTVNGYASSYFDELPASEAEAADWAYHDFWQPAGCEDLSTTFSQTVCLDTAFLHGLSAWDYFLSLYSEYPDDEMACEVIDERSYWRDPDAPYTAGWFNRDADLAALNDCWG